MSALDGERVARETGRVVEYRERTGSTNDDARELAAAGAPHGTAVLADAQRSGRGRRGSVWVSPPGKNLIVSVVLRPAMPPEHWPRLTQAVALAVCDSLDALPGLAARAEVKWPNDIYLSDRKVCGILVETVLEREGGFVIAGAGVNLNLLPDDFPPELRKSATSAWIENGGVEVDRSAFAVTFLRALLRRSEQAERDFPAVMADVTRRSWLAGKRVSLRQNELVREGVVSGFGAEGELLLSLPDGTVEAVLTADLIRPV